MVQAFVFAIGAVASGGMFKRWWRLDEDDRQRVWNHYGRFCGIMCINCITGAVASVAWALFLAAHHQSDFNAVSFGSSQYVHALSSYALVGGL
jgi:hypothetical protein